MSTASVPSQVLQSGSQPTTAGLLVNLHAGVRFDWVDSRVGQSHSNLGINLEDRTFRDRSLSQFLWREALYDLGMCQLDLKWINEGR